MSETMLPWIAFFGFPLLAVILWIVIFWRRLSEAVPPRPDASTARGAGGVVTSPQPSTPRSLFERLGEPVWVFSFLVIVAAVIDAIIVIGAPPLARLLVIGVAIVSLLVFITKRITKRVDNRHLAQALVAGSLGTVLILLESIVTDFNFHLEELLLASGGLNMLMEEARLSEEYKKLDSRRKEALEQTENVIKDVATFRRRIFSAAEIFGPGTRSQDRSVDPPPADPPVDPPPADPPTKTP